MTQPPPQGQGWWQPRSGQQATGFGGHPGQGYPGQYGGLGAFEQSPPTRGKRSKKPLLIAGAVVVVAAAGVLAAWLLGPFGGPVLERASLEKEVARVLQESYGERDVTDTRCPADQPIDPGHTFSCAVTVSGTPMNVRIRVLNDKPVFTVGAPHR